MGQELLDPISRLALHVFRAQQSLSSVGDELTAQWGMTSAKWKVLGAVELSDAPPTAAGIGRIWLTVFGSVLALVILALLRRLERHTVN